MRRRRMGGFTWKLTNLIHTLVADPLMSHPERKESLISALL